MNVAILPGCVFCVVTCPVVITPMVALHLIVNALCSDIAHLYLALCSDTPCSDKANGGPSFDC